MKEQIPQEVLIAFHEAGHVVAAYKLGCFRPTFATIVRSGDGRVLVCQSEEALLLVESLETLVPGDVDSSAEAEAEADIMLFLAGLAAACRRQRVPWGKASSILEQELDHIEAEGCDPDSYFAADCYPYAPPDTDVERASALIGLLEPDPWAQRRRILALWKETWRLLGRSWGDVERVAAALLERKTLPGPELDKLLLPPAERRPEGSCDEKVREFLKAHTALPQEDGELDMDHFMWLMGKDD